MKHDEQCELITMKYAGGWGRACSCAERAYARDPYDWAEAPRFNERRELIDPKRDEV